MQTVDFKVKGIIFDSDGVLTDGRVIVSETGVESRNFDIHDGAGLVLLRKNGIKIGIVSSSKCRAVVYRATNLGVSDVHVGVPSKSDTIADILKDWGLGWQDIAYVGDDLIDLEPMARCKLPIAVANAVSVVKAAASFVTQNQGGFGAAREVADLVAEANGISPVQNHIQSI